MKWIDWKTFNHKGHEGERASQRINESAKEQNSKWQKSKKSKKQISKGANRQMAS